jgi:hypothetical protein
MVDNASSIGRICRSHRPMLHPWVVFAGLILQRLKAQFSFFDQVRGGKLGISIQVILYVIFFGVFSFCTKLNGIYKIIYIS